MYIECDYVIVAFLLILSELVIVFKMSKRACHNMFVYNFSIHFDARNNRNKERVYSYLTNYVAELEISVSFSMSIVNCVYLVYNICSINHDYLFCLDTKAVCYKINNIALEQIRWLDQSDDFSSPESLHLIQTDAMEPFLAYNFNT